MRDTRKVRDIRAGALRTPVALGRPTVTRDAAGGEVVTWDEFSTWAAIEPVNGREWAGAVAIKDTVDARITLRITPGWMPSARWRVRDPATGTIYSLMAVMPLPTLGAVECLAKTAAISTDGR